MAVCPNAQLQSKKWNYSTRENIDLFEHSFFLHYALSDKQNLKVLSQGQTLLSLLDSSHVVAAVKRYLLLTQTRWGGLSSLIMAVRANQGLLVVNETFMRELIIKLCNKM